MKTNTVMVLLVGLAVVAFIVLRRLDRGVQVKHSLNLGGFFS